MSFFKPSRQSKFNLIEPLLITPLRTRQNLITSRFQATVPEFLDATVNEANNANGNWLLKYCDTNQVNMSEYLVLSEDPFSFYNTWIHKNDWNNYMESLAPSGGISIRQFMSPNQTDAYTACDKLLNAVGERDIQLQGVLTDTERNRIGLDPGQMQSDQEAGALVRRRKITSILKNKRTQGIHAFDDKAYSFLNGQTKIQVDLTAQKMNDAAGKRAKELSQKAVMGDQSASDISKTLGWETGRLTSGNYASEWLHLAAFSWGGYTMAESETEPSTSQNLENLIFGTSETNSVMTRYEMAWQSFFRLEQELHNSLYDDLDCVNYDKNVEYLKGQLQITCNDFTQDIQYDACGNQGYSIQKKKLNQALVAEFSKRANNNMGESAPLLNCELFRRLANNDPSFKRVLEINDHALVQNGDNSNNNTTAAQMLALAFDFPFIVYSMKYEVQASFPSRLLKAQSPGGAFWFFPFQRSLFHQGEAALDAVIWSKLKQKAKEAVENERLEYYDKDDQENRKASTILKGPNSIHKPVLEPKPVSKQKPGSLPIPKPKPKIFNVVKNLALKY